MLRHAPIRLKLAVVLLVPVIALIALAAVRAASNLETSRQADELATETEFALAGTALADELQSERGLTVRVLAAGRQPDISDLQAQRSVVGEALDAWEARAAELDTGGLEPAVLERLDAARSRLAGLRELRQDVDTGRIQVDPAVEAYTAMVAELLNTNRRLLPGVGDPQLAESVTAFVTLSRVKELSAIQREQVSHAALAGGRLTEGGYEAFTSQLANAEVLLAEFVGASGPEQERLFVDTVVGPEVQRVRELRSAVLDAGAGKQLDVDADEWWSVASFELGLLRQVEQQLGAAALARAADIEQAAVSRSLVEGAAILLVLLLSVGLSLYVARLLITPLRGLRSSAETVAQTQLPGIVQRLHRGEPIDVEAETAPVHVPTRDEVGQVAWAFNAVHSVAIRVAAEQAALRAAVGRLFLNLGHRIQGLVSGQLELLDELERSELDPEQLRSLFRLDHMATRMRRNAENLLVLAGAEPSRRWNEPIALAGILRAATAEIEDYTRISLLPMADVRVAGEAVSDVAHLLAELLENATKFSPAGTHVQVSGEVAPRGFMVEIEDQGVGMTDTELAEVNQRLAEPPMVDLITEQRLGVFVVGRLAARHGIRVRLRRSWFGGVTALVLLPNGLIVNPEAAQQQPAGAIDRGGGAPPALARSSRNGAVKHAAVASRHGLTEPLTGAPGAPAATGGPPVAQADRPGVEAAAGQRPGMGKGPVDGAAMPPSSHRPGHPPAPEPRPRQAPGTAAPAGAGGPAPLPRRIRGARGPIRSAPPSGGPLGGPAPGAPSAPAGQAPGGTPPGGPPGSPRPGGAPPGRPLPMRAGRGGTLPRRVRGANLAPDMAAAFPEPGVTGPRDSDRAAPDKRRVLSSFQSGVARGRNDASLSRRPRPGDAGDRGSDGP